MFLYDSFHMQILFGKGLTIMRKSVFISLGPIPDFGRDFWKHAFRGVQMPWNCNQKADGWLLLCVWKLEEMYCRSHNTSNAVSHCVFLLQVRSKAPITEPEWPAVLGGRLVILLWYWTKRPTTKPSLPLSAGCCRRPELTVSLRQWECGDV